MRKIVPQMLRQRAVYWPPLPVDAYGQPSWGSPIEVKCRWEDAQDPFQDSRSERNAVQAVVFVDRDVLENGVLMLGELDSSVDVDDPKLNPNAWEIARFVKQPSLQATEFLRMATLGTSISRPTT